MPAPYSTTRRVEFHDTDMAGIMHFTAYFKYMESAEHELLRHLGLSVVSGDGEDALSWPRVSASCNFQSPVRFEDRIDIEVHVTGLEERSVTYQFRFRREGRDVALGEMTSVCCRVGSNGLPKSVPIPPSFAEKLMKLVE